MGLDNNRPVRYDISTKQSLKTDYSPWIVVTDMILNFCCSFVKLACRTVQPYTLDLIRFLL